MNPILLVEDSAMLGRLAKAKIEQAFDTSVYWCKSLADADNLLKRAGGNFSMALLDFNLPDAPYGEVIDRVVSEGISSLVFTSDMTNEVRKQVWSKKVADYILKEDPNCLDYIIAAMKQLVENENTLVLVVDDSKSQRTAISDLLYVHKYRVLNAKDGETALAILEQYPEIKLVITDYHMPGMDGCKLCQRIREKYKHDRLAIIGLSSEEDRTLGARFVKSGANDFLVKQSFLVEEFYCRITHCLDILHLIEKNREGAIKDFLTGIYNRRYFFDQGEKLLADCQEKNRNLFCTMLDLDFFKNINDQYGHDAGDQVLKHFAALLTGETESKEIVARIGGEEFCILSPDFPADEYRLKVEKLRKTIAASPVTVPSNKTTIQVTASIGWAQLPAESLDTLLQAADANLYLAKEHGRNCAVG